MLVLGLVLGTCGEQGEHGPSWSIVDEPWTRPAPPPSPGSWLEHPGAHSRPTESI